MTVNVIYVAHVYRIFIVVGPMEDTKTNQSLHTGSSRGLQFVGEVGEGNEIST